ncbi:hypothetical protein ASC97_04100 [Rhizobium sp. Root1203]|uniref:DUF2303 family protein n=1 Tax=Rhizobium sp. Root1203 TaxID=1736427 RepID=UPI00070B9975|nr:DUF2303 family protein [Rhizobium sp. Root1203]KQV27569.1 hypothetical protein ASC97_04100 [Rhizobium sp. Root1203]
MTTDNPELKSAMGVDIEAITALADKAGSKIEMLVRNDRSHGVPEQIPVFVNREDGRVDTVADLFERYRFAPARKSGTAKVTTLESFIDLGTRHATPASAIFADTDWQKPSLTMVVDYHENDTGGTADNGKHRIRYDFPLSDEWKAWVGIDGKPMEQTVFAEFIEDHIAELSTPDDGEEEDFRHKFGFRVAYPTEMHTLSRGLQVFAETRVKNAVTLQTGEGQIAFEEEHKDANGNKIDVPGMFILSVSPFFMGEPVRIPVRLRYRLQAGSIKWIIKLYRPDVYITKQVMRDMEKAASETGTPSFQGQPEMSA